MDSDRGGRPGRLRRSPTEGVAFKVDVSAVARRVDRADSACPQCPLRLSVVLGNVGVGMIEQVTAGRQVILLQDLADGNPDETVAVLCV